MTAKQVSEFKTLLIELEDTYPEIRWSYSPSAYDPFPSITGLTERGGFRFSSYKNSRRVVELSLNFNDTTKSNGNGVLVSSGFGIYLVKEQLERASFARYLAFVRENAAKIKTGVTA